MLQGDSGGPLACRDDQNRWHLVGVTSFGFEGCIGFSVFAKVSAYIDYIETIMQNNS